MLKTSKNAMCCKSIYFSFRVGVYVIKWKNMGFFENKLSTFDIAKNLITPIKTK
jgi:hypothetical protein